MGYLSWLSIGQYLVPVVVPAAAEASTLARVISAILFPDLAASVNAGSTIPELLASIRTQIGAILPH
ncbi:hypothetical protein GCM10011374_32130 [Kocuria dechangensis]|uniref:Uncharacterized protein n=1 Tax=Kocuria dechangensis TaxID=1176249 RepID=A0A917H309_9MICC|nr:hypothetical protein [Kocuria dechangensis]GGG65787.1 hypothetical protein GCM10011374_32130 [Kocuria dechangensis]